MPAHQTTKSPTSPYPHATRGSEGRGLGQLTSPLLLLPPLPSSRRGGGGEAHPLPPCRVLRGSQRQVVPDPPVERQHALLVLRLLHLSPPPLLLLSLLFSACDRARRKERVQASTASPAAPARSGATNGTGAATQRTVTAPSCGSGSVRTPGRCPPSRSSVPVGLCSFQVSHSVQRCGERPPPLPSLSCSSHHAALSRRPRRRAAAPVARSP